jgi:hypothetical protein
MQRASSHAPAWLPCLPACQVQALSSQLLDAEDDRQRMLAVRLMTEVRMRPAAWAGAWRSMAAKRAGCCRCMQAQRSPPHPSHGLQMVAGPLAPGLTSNDLMQLAGFLSSKLSDWWVNAVHAADRWALTSHQVATRAPLPPPSPPIAAHQHSQHCRLTPLPALRPLQAVRRSSSRRLHGPAAARQPTVPPAPASARCAGHRPGVPLRLPRAIPASGGARGLPGPVAGRHAGGLPVASSGQRRQALTVSHRHHRES